MSGNDVGEDAVGVRRTGSSGRQRSRLLIAAVYLALVVLACITTLPDCVYDRGDGLQFMWLGLLGLPWVVPAVGLGYLVSFAPGSVDHAVSWVLLPAPCAINVLWLAWPDLRAIWPSNRTTTPLSQ